MAHRIQFTNDIILPSKVQQYRLKLQKQIKELRQRQQLLAQEHKQKILMLEKRLLYGKKKIFSFDKKMTHMTLTDQLSHYHLQVEALKKAIQRQEQLIRDRQNQQQSPLPQFKLQYFPSRMVLPGMDHEPQAQKGPSSPLMSVRRSFSISDPSKMAGSQKSLKNIPLSGDPQQDLLKLTHEIMRLKKSLQQVRSKYSDNFTEYKLRQEYEKLKQNNAAMTQQLKQLQTLNSINQYKQLSNQDVDYGEMQSITARREYELLMKDKKILQEHLHKVQREKQQQETSDKVKVMEFNQNKIDLLKKQIDQMTKNNEIIQNQLTFIEKEIKQRKNYQQTLRARLPL